VGLLAGAIHAGVYGQHPSWTTLDPANDNLKCTVTMGEYYATLAKLMGVSPGDILAGNPAPIPTSPSEPAPRRTGVIGVVHDPRKRHRFG